MSIKVILRVGLFFLQWEIGCFLHEVLLEARVLLDTVGPCSNMMFDWFTEIGIGCYDTQNYLYWTQNFGSR